jgi:hypothetical protein
LKVVVTYLRTGKVAPLVITPFAIVDKAHPEALLGWGLDKGVTAYQEYVLPPAP